MILRFTSPFLVFFVNWQNLNDFGIYEPKKRFINIKWPKTQQVGDFRFSRDFFIEKSKKWPPTFAVFIFLVFFEKGEFWKKTKITHPGGFWPFCIYKSENFLPRKIPKSPRLWQIKKKTTKTLGFYLGGRLVGNHLPR